MSARKAIFLFVKVIMALGMVNSAVKVEAAQELEPDLALGQIQALIPLSLELVGEAVTVLDQGWSQMSTSERETFLRLYDPAGTGEIDDQYVDQVLNNYLKIEQILTNNLQVSYALQIGPCVEERLYYTDLTRIFVCPYFFEEKNELRKARTLIHETAHMALLAADRPYYQASYMEAYTALTPRGSWPAQLPVVGPVIREVLRGDTLHHPDAYAHYALQSAGYANVFVTYPRQESA